MRNQLSAYADGELRPIELRAVEDHLACCQACAQEYSVVKQVVSLTTAIPEEAVPSTLHTAIMTRIAWAEMQPEISARTERRPSQAQMWAWGALAGAALTGATASLALGLLNGHHSPGGTGLAKMAPAPDAHAASPQETASRPVERKVYVRMAPRERSQVASAAPVVERVAAPAQAPDTASPRATRPAARVSPGARTAPAVKPAPADAAVDPRPEVAVEPEKPATATPDTAGPGTPSTTVMASMPGPSKGDSTDAMSASMIASMEHDGAARGGSADEGDSTQDSDEGLQMLKSFLQERSQMVPQPPAFMPAPMRRMRKTL